MDRQPLHPHREQARRLLSQIRRIRRWSLTTLVATFALPGVPAVVAAALGLPQEALDFIYLWLVLCPVTALVLLGVIMPKENRLTDRLFALGPEALPEKLIALNDRIKSSKSGLLYPGMVQLAAITHDLQQHVVDRLDREPSLALLGILRAGAKGRSYSHPPVREFVHAALAFLRVTPADPDLFAGLSRMSRRWSLTKEGSEVKQVLQNSGLLPP